MIFFGLGGCMFFLPERLRDFFLAQEAACIFFGLRGCINVVLPERLHDLFLARKVA